MGLIFNRRYATGNNVGRIANRGLKPTATIGGRYATKCAGSHGNGSFSGIFSDSGTSPRIIRVAAPVSFRYQSEGSPS